MRREVAVVASCITHSLNHSPTHSPTWSFVAGPLLLIPVCSKLLFLFSSLLFSSSAALFCREFFWSLASVHHQIWCRPATIKICISTEKKGTRSLTYTCIVSHRRKERCDFTKEFQTGEQRGANKSLPLGCCGVLSIKEWQQRHVYI